MVTITRPEERPVTITRPEERPVIPEDLGFMEPLEEEHEGILVAIEQRHIDTGVVGSIHECPIAHAINEMKLDDCNDWFVDNTGAVVSETIVAEWDYYYCLDKAGEGFLVAFDNKEPVHPCEIRLLGDHV